MSAIETQNTQKNIEKKTIKEKKNKMIVKKKDEKKEEIIKEETPESSEVDSESESEDDEEEDRIIKEMMERKRIKNDNKLNKFESKNGIKELKEERKRLEKKMKEIDEEIKEIMKKAPKKLKFKLKSKSTPLVKKEGRGRNANDADLKWILSSNKNMFPPCCSCEAGEVEFKWNKTLIELKENDYETWGDIKESTWTSGHKTPYRTQKSIDKHIAQCNICE